MIDSPALPFRLIKMTQPRILTLLGFLFLFTLPLKAEEPKLRCPAIFGSHMVLQQGREIPVWGWAKPGATVTVTFKDKSGQTTAGDDGKWRVRLPALATPKDPVWMTVSSGGETLEFSDILLGDVWLCSGQSNMAMGVGAMKRADAIIANADHPKIRLFMVNRQVAFDPADELASDQGEWVVCSPETINMAGGFKGFSAVGYFFGRAIQESQGIPVGLIGTYVGGSNITSWVPRETLASSPRDSLFWKRNREFELDLKTLDEDVANFQKAAPLWEKALQERNAKNHAAITAWKTAVAQAKESGAKPPARPAPLPVPPNRPKDPLGNFHQPTSLYNGMIHPLAPFALTGALWYQGEANSYPGMAEEYRDNLGAMIRDWRVLWAQGDFPFFVVQLPNLKSSKDTWPIVRESQRLAVQETPNTGLAVTYDVGDPNDLHPAEKQAIGERLALLARNQIYGESIVASGPMIEAANAKNGSIALSFEHTGSGLMTGSITEPEFRAKPSNEALRGFEVAGPDGSYIPANAAIEGNQVLLNAPVAVPKSVRYAWAPDPDANLYNREGLPTAPFQVDLP